MSDYDIDASLSGSVIILNNVVRKDGGTLRILGGNCDWIDRIVGRLYAEDTMITGNATISELCTADRFASNSNLGAIDESSAPFIDLRFQDGYLQYRKQTISIKGGIVPPLGAETEWETVYGWLYMSS